MLPHATAHGVARLDKALVQVVLAAVGPDAFLVEEVLLMAPFPHVVSAQLGGRGVAVLDNAGVPWSGAAAAGTPRGAGSCRVWRRH
ncbi:hypothetical protein [Corynebacterium stationis]|uniref:hypothetical protein n=1 Tax=Corynebacterium stationis TaxID=1705 RepID=UPI00321FD0CE